MKKVSCRQQTPNPLFEEWLFKLYEDAKLSNSRLVGRLEEALESLIKYPMRLESGAECLLLKGFDRKLCEYLDQMLSKYSSASSSPEVIATGSDDSISNTSSLSFREHSTQSKNNSPASDRRPSVDLTEIPELSSKPDIVPEKIDKVQDLDTAPSDYTRNTCKGKIKSKSEIKTGKYKPAHRSGGYAILVALLEQSLEHPDKTALTKEELIEKAQKHAEESLVRRKHDSFYSAWSSMATLQKKGLVTKSKRKKPEYMLTEEGRELAREILEDAKNIPTLNDIIFKGIPSTSSTSTQENADINVNDEIPPVSGNISPKNIIEMASGTFDIILLIDKNETRGLRKKNDPTVAQFNKYPDLKHEYRSLKIGDFAWIAKHKVDQEQELVLPYIIERKRMDDLGASIKDGRFHEQKFRLRKCGLDNVIYMIENYGKNIHVGLPIQNLMQAIANTRGQDGFKVHVTDSHTNSARFLAIMTKRLTIRYKDKHLRGCNDDPRGGMLMTFEYFNKSSAKTKPLTVTETFIKELLQLKGMSVDKALAITKKYPTPKSLILAYIKCDRKEGETLLAHLKYGALYRNVGPATSKAIYQLVVQTSSNLKLCV